ncbi:hypothetical protein KO507_08970 [Gilvimarinus agarilyticus]|uniref:N-acetyltransferase domain-containing protein n=1 Tax=Reichenbachiella agariperforans TaxID=156994 RepID=A0A1M6VY85_REIAG|nr:hypothetical protein [Reichenbachiella agariperforans]MBU2885890.1 hypothetical protein [Gilvimarinus agarilyticus]SHK86430.1 hypothetical protein SAMN04488028_11047 [Reichenbachiella agariperforans]
MNLIEVTTPELEKEFVLFPVKLYQDCPFWIRPLDKDVKLVFDRKKNPTFNHGACVRWLLQREGQTIGRIAAFVNNKTAVKDNDQPTGGCGFFECIDDQQAANMLFDAARDWLAEIGMEAMDGPVNFGDRDKWWGLLVDGYTIEPNYQCNYHFPYYRELFENYGFEVYFKQFTFIRKTFDPFHPRVQHKADLLSKDPDYSFEHMRIKQLDKYAEDFRVVYNQAWANHDGVVEMTKDESAAIMKQMKPILDEKIIWFAYYKGEPVAFYVNLPEVNQIFKHVNGKLNWVGKIKFVLHKLFKTNKKMLGLVFGVVPAHQGKGLDGALVMATAKMVQQDYKRYPILEMNWIGDFNRKMILVVKQIGGDIGKTHHTYRYLFDREKPFARMPIK